MTSISNAFGFLKTKATEVAAKVGDQVTTINEQVTKNVLPTSFECPFRKLAPSGEVLEAAPRLEYRVDRVSVRVRAVEPSGYLVKRLLLLLFAIAAFESGFGVTEVSGRRKERSGKEPLAAPALDTFETGGATTFHPSTSKLCPLLTSPGVSHTRRGCDTPAALIGCHHLVR